MCICSLRYPARNAHAPYCHLCPAPLYHIFPHYLINGTILEKKLPNTKCVFWFSVQLLCETFTIIRRLKTATIKTVHMYSCKLLVTLVGFWLNLDFAQKFSKYIQISNSMKIRPLVVVPCGQTDWQSLFSTIPQTRLKDTGYSSLHKMDMTVKHTYLFTNYTHSDMFRLESSSGILQNHI